MVTGPGIELDHFELRHCRPGNVPFLGVVFLRSERAARHEPPLKALLEFGFQFKPPLDEDRIQFHSGGSVEAKAVALLLRNQRIDLMFKVQRHLRVVLLNYLVVENVRDLNVLHTVVFHFLRPLLPRTCELTFEYPKAMTPSSQVMFTNTVFRELPAIRLRHVDVLEVRPDEVCRGDCIEGFGAGSPLRVELTDCPQVVLDDVMSNDDVGVRQHLKAERNGVLWTVLPEPVDLVGVHVFDDKDMNTGRVVAVRFNVEDSYTHPISFPVT